MHLCMRTQKYSYKYRRKTGQKTFIIFYPFQLISPVLFFGQKLELDKKNKIIIWKRLYLIKLIFKYTC